MKYLVVAILSTVLIALALADSAFAQRTARLADNAALRYWSAFSEIQDVAITDQQAKELNAILDGTAPYNDLKYKDLLEKNRLALEIMAQGTSLPSCDWGLDYRFGQDVPVNYARKALVLGRLNVLYVFHLLKAGDKDAAVRVLAAGLRFSHDVSNGGSLFATLVAKDLLMNHLRGAAEVLHLEQLSVTQRSVLQSAIRKLGDGLDWRAAAKRDLEALSGDRGPNSQASAALTRIIPVYVAALNDESKLSALDEILQVVPKEVASVIPNAKRVLEEKRDLNNTLLQTRLLFR